jgi:hypothetical protein
MISGSPFGGPSAPCNSCKVYLAAKSAIKFFARVEKHFASLHRLACPVCLHASQTKVAAASFTEAILGLTGMLQLQSKAKFRTLV